MKSLARQLQVFEKEIKVRVNIYKIKYAQAIMFNLIMTTPVDTSAALSNWIANLNSEKGILISPHSVGRDGSTESVSSIMAYSLGNAIIQRAKVGEIIYITNSIDYLKLLNSGWSTQAEPNYIENAVNDAKAQMLRVKI